jgi:hypothetical protein
VLGEGRVGALIRAVCTDLCGPVEEPALQSHALPQVDAVLHHGAASIYTAPPSSPLNPGMRGLHHQGGG